MKVSFKSKTEEHTFWDFAWSSEELSKKTEMLDRLIPHTSVEFSYNLLGNIKGKQLLDVGCGSGLLTVELCSKGAFVTAIDLSEESIKATKEICQEKHIKNIVIHKMNAEALSFKDNSFDVVYASRMLMHTDKDKVLRESMRVLKKGGILVLSEPLKHWIFAFPYRMFSPYRKSCPQYVALADFDRLSTEHKEFYLLSTFFFFLFYLPVNKRIAFGVFNAFAVLDESLFRLFPFLKNFAWISVAWMRK